jgi:hypothetical protein
MGSLSLVRRYLHGRERVPTGRVRHGPAAGLEETRIINHHASATNGVTRRYNGLRLSAWETTMAEDPQHEATSARMVRAYHHMLERARHLFEHDEEPFSLREAIDDASRRAVEFGELTRGEAEQVAEYVRRDLHDAGEYLSRTRRELREWAQIDLSMVEQGLLDLFTRAADRSRIEYEQFKRELSEGPPYRSGEMTGPGTLRCEACGQHMQFHEPGHIPPCPHCHQTLFRRHVEEES